jgi:hypothetical protein
MGTKNHRVAGYLPSSVYERFQQFKVERQFGDSQVLIHILSEYFGVNQSVAHSELPNVLERVERLESSLLTIKSEMLDDLKRVLLMELGSQTLMAETPSSQRHDEPIFMDSQLSVSEGCIDVTHQVTHSELINESPSESPSPQGGIACLAIDLSKRFECGQSTIAARKKDAPDRFAEWTSTKDPDRISWKFNSESGTFSPIGDVPPAVREALRPKVAEGLSHGDLAKRLNMDYSTLSHWKKKKSAEDLAKSIQEKDPEGFGWIFNQGTGRFIKGESSLPRVTQGELPTTGHQEAEDF